MATTYRLRADVSILQRPRGGVQVGLDVSDQIRFDDAPPGADVLLAGLRRGRTSAALERARGAVPRAWLRTAIARLLDAGLIHTAPQRPVDVVVLGEGRLAETLLWAAGRAGAVGSAQTWGVDDSPGRVVVLCPDTVEPDRVTPRALTQRGRAHLVVRAEPERMVVGPFVTSGTACLTCTDLVRRDLDPDWPHLLLQLCRTRSRPTAAQAAWAAGTALAQISAWAADEVPDTWGATLELGTADGALGRRRWPLRPDCAAHAPLVCAASTASTDAP